MKGSSVDPSLVHQAYSVSVPSCFPLAGHGESITTVASISNFQKIRQCADGDLRQDSPQIVGI